VADLFWAYWDATIRFALLALILLVITPLLKRMIAAEAALLGLGYIASEVGPPVFIAL
jgi:hypothetical protein